MFMEKSGDENQEIVIFFVSGTRSLPKRPYGSAKRADLRMSLITRTHSRFFTSMPFFLAAFTFI